MSKSKRLLFPIISTALALISLARVFYLSQMWGSGVSPSDVFITMWLPVLAFVLYSIIALRIFTNYRGSVGQKSFIGGFIGVFLILIPYTYALIHPSAELFEFVFLLIAAVAITLLGAIIGWIVGIVTATSRSKKDWLVGLFILTPIILFIVAILAYQQKNKIDVQNQNDTTINDLALYDQALKNLDLSSCNKITTFGARCTAEVLAIKNNDVSYCDNFSGTMKDLDQIMCYERFAKVKNDFSVCNRVSPIYFNECRQLQDIGGK